MHYYRSSDSSASKMMHRGVHRWEREGDWRRKQARRRVHLRVEGQCEDTTTSNGTTIRRLRCGVRLSGDDFCGGSNSNKPRLCRAATADLSLVIKIIFFGLFRGRSPKRVQCTVPRNHRACAGQAVLALPIEWPLSSARAASLCRPRCHCAAIPLTHPIASLC